MKHSSSSQKFGHFWLPDKPNIKVPGLLKIEDDGKLILETLGSFHGLVEFMQTSQPNIGRLNGLMHDGKRITLNGCIYRNRNTSWGGSATATIYATYLFIGVNLIGEDPLALTSLRFSLEGLNDWLSVKAFEVENDWENHGSIVKFKAAEKIAIVLNNDLTLEINFKWFPPNEANPSEVAIRQEAYIAINNSKLLPLAELMNAANKILNFFCFAMDRTVGLKNVVGFSKEITHNFPDGTIIKDPVEIHYQSVKHEEIYIAKKSEICFSITQMWKKSFPE